MKRNYIVVCISLLVSLFIYLFYRTDRTLVNDMVIRIISLENYIPLKQRVVRTLPLSNIVIYSLPEGLWVFCITLTSKPYYLRLSNLRIDCVFIPLIFYVGLELFQLFHITNGTFDVMDIGLSTVFWLLGCYIFPYEHEKQNIITRLNTSRSLCLGSYCIVYLAHVFK